jgi:archaemetzincin
MNNIYLTKLFVDDIVDIDKFTSVIKETYDKLNPAGFNINLIDSLPDLDFAYDKIRKQYYAPMILNELEKYLPENGRALIAVTDKDLYDQGLNFIFGEANNRISIVSINRFKPCSWKDKEKEVKLLYDRTTKTIIHELGHIFGLGHCDDKKCVMFFSNWLDDTDTKTKKACTKCVTKLSQQMKCTK